jgi:alkylation response protein AidB-like acyl-CoA dehydrogenase
MYSLHLSAEQLEFRDTVRGFVEDEVKPVVLKSDRLDAGDRTLPLAVLDKASQMGLRTLSLPEAMGGIGADALTCCLIAEELAAGDADIAAVLAETAALAAPLFSAMTDNQRGRFLDAFVADDRFHLAYAGHEPDTDTSLGINYHRAGGGERRVRTRAERRGGQLVVNGVKDAVANAGVAKLFAVEVATDQGVRVLLVPSDAKGLSVTEAAAPHWYHGSSGEIVLKDCEVPAENLLPAGFSFDAGAGPLGLAVNLGIGRAAFEAALDYAQLRVQGGRPIVEHQAIGGKLAEVAVRLEVSRAAIWQAAWASDHPAAQADRSLPDLPLAAVARVFASEAIYRAVKDAAECFGAMGVMRDMPLQKYITDARICLYSGEGNGDLKLRIAEALSGFRRAPLLAAE